MLHMSNTVQKIEGSALTPGAFSHTLCLDSDKEISTQLPKNTSNYSPLAPKLESILQHLPLSSHAGEQLTRGMRYVPYSYDNLLGQIKSHMPSSPHSPATGSCDFEHDLRAAELRQIWRKQHTRSSSQGSLGCSPTSDRDTEEPVEARRQVSASNTPLATPVATPTTESQHTTTPLSAINATSQRTITPLQYLKRQMSAARKKVIHHCQSLNPARCYTDTGR